LCANERKNAGDNGKNKIVIQSALRSEMPDASKVQNMKDNETNQIHHPIPPTIESAQRISRDGVEMVHRRRNAADHRKFERSDPRCIW
jgi:hypothetical protein